jgi:two-component system nitrate/nitrite response regulator NarL
MRVLIADDHDLLRDTLVMFLESKDDIETSAAANLAQAHHLIEAEPRFDLILLDLNMPGMHGLTGLRKTLHMKQGQRVALLSGDATKDVVEQALEE